MRITLRQLQIFLAVAQSGSTTAAAGLVALSQSAASAALNELESLLGVQLFDRVGKRLVLNDSGRQLLPQARHMLDAAQTIERQFSDPAAGSDLHLGASTTIGSYLLPAMIAAYRRSHAGARVRALVANTADIVEAVVNFEVDAGLIEGPCHADDVQVEPWMMLQRKSMSDSIGGCKNQFLERQDGGRCRRPDELPAVRRAGLTCRSIVR